MGKIVRLDGPLARRHRATLIGSGPHLVVFSHGFGTDQTVWSAVAALLPADITALVYDLPGASPSPPEDFDPDAYRSLSAFADELLAMLEEIGAKEVVYVGHSVSGMIGVLAAIEEPSRFSKLLLLNASPRYLDDANYKGGLAREDLDRLFNAMSANYQAWVAGFAPAAVGADAPSAVETFSAGLLAMRPDLSLRIARTIFESDVRALLPLLRTPTVLIQARGDVVVPEAVGSYLEAHLRGSRLVWIEAEGHLPHLSAPQTVADALKANLAA